MFSSGWILLTCKHVHIKTCVVFTQYSGSYYDPGCNSSYIHQQSLPRLITIYWQINHFWFEFRMEEISYPSAQEHLHHVFQQWETLWNIMSFIIPAVFGLPFWVTMYSFFHLYIHSFACNCFLSFSFCLWFVGAITIIITLYQQWIFIAANY